VILFGGNLFTAENAENAEKTGASTQ
jgi:hypothetical protein